MFRNSRYWARPRKAGIRQLDWPTRLITDQIDATHELTIIHFGCERKSLAGGCNISSSDCSSRSSSSRFRSFGRAARQTKQSSATVDGYSPTMDQPYLNLTFRWRLALDKGAVFGITGVPGPSEADKLPSKPSLPNDTTIAFALTLAARGALRPSEDEEGAGGALKGGSRVEGVGRVVAVDVVAVALDEAAVLLEATVAGSSRVRCAGRVGRPVGVVASMIMSPLSCSLVVPFGAAVPKAGASTSVVAVAIAAALGSLEDA